VAEFESSLRAGCEREDFRVVHYSIQRDHIHLIVEADHPDALGRGMKALSARLGWTARRALRHAGPLLADRYHLRVLRTPRQVRNAIAYVLQNARKHAVESGRNGAPPWQVDPASSGRWFAGWREPVATASGPAAVASPRTWLARAGWRRGGTISTGDVPGR
jgi:REP element-mobilizing transposase RayT